MTANAGYAVLQVIPSVRGISEELRRQLVAPAADAGDQAGEQASAGFKGKFKAGMVAAGAVAGAALAAATVSAIEKEKVGDRLAAQLGLSGKGAQRAGKIAGNLYGKAVTDSFEEAADAVRATMSSGLIDEKASTKAIEGISTKVSDLAKTFDQDLTGTANAAAQMIRTGLAKDGAEALDVLARGFQSGADKAGDLLDTFNEYGVQFQNMGLSGKTAMGLINQGLKAGARDSDVVADTIKEFSIEAVKGADAVKGGFKHLGLDADSMVKQLTAGGPTAAKAFDLVFDRLRKMEPGAKRNAVAFELFGTKAEDVGQALFALDPSSAADALGKVSGAAKKVGDTIRGNTATEIEILKRQFTSLLGDVVQSVVLPGLNGLIVAVKAVTAGLAAGGRWVREYGAWFLPLIVAVVGLTIALNAEAISVAAVSAVFAVYRAVILAGTAVTQGFAAAQALLNSIMNLNPITLVVIALLALGVALVVAWKKSETFRAIVMAMWEGIKTAALFVWNSVLKPALQGIWTAMQAVGRVALWLWNNAIGPAFRFIWTAAKVLFAVVATAVLFPLIVAFKLVSFAVRGLWQYYWKPAFTAIAFIATWLWNTIAKPVFAAFMAGIRALGAVAKWLYSNAIKPVFTQIRNAIVIWWAATRNIFIIVTRFLRDTLGAAFRRLLTTVIRPTWNAIKAVISTAWNGIKAVISGVWNTSIRPTFNAVKAGVSAVGKAFDSAVDFIAKVWDGLKSVAKKPVQFVVDTVYNNGIRKVWNTVAGLVGLKKLDPVKFAEGGRTHGGTPGKDSIPSLLMADEFVVKRDSARKVGFGTLEYINQTGSLPGFAAGGRVLPVQRFAEGGIVGWLTGAAKKVGGAVLSGIDFLSSPGKAWDQATGFVRDKLAGLQGSEWARAIAQFPLKMLKGLKDHLVQAAKGLFGGGAAKGSVGAALAFAKSQVGDPYVWGGVGPNGFDCSGFLGALQSVVMGQNPYRRLWSTFSFQGSSAPAGWKRNLRSPYMIGITNKGVGHTAGTLAGVNVESRGGEGVVVGRRARGYNSPLFTHRYGFAPALKFDQGGQVPPGYHAVYNGTRKPEPVLTGAQWDAVFSAARGGSEPKQVQVMPGAQVTLREAVDVDMLADRLEFAARSASF